MKDKIKLTQNIKETLTIMGTRNHKEVTRQIKQFEKKGMKNMIEIGHTRIKQVELAQKYVKQLVVEE